MRAGKVFVLVAAAALGGCGGNADEPGPAAEQSGLALEVATVNGPLAYMAERIGGDLVEVVFPAPADVDPAFWSPGADIVAAYQEADLILLNGGGYAKWVSLASLPRSRVVDTGSSFADRLIELEDVTTHSHGSEGEHVHGGWAFTTWLDPELAASQAQAVAAALIARRPGRQAELNLRLGGLQHDLADLDRRLAAAAAALDGEPLVFSHPVYQYLIRRYDLNAVELHWEPDELPDEHAWRRLEALLQTHPARWMLWESEPLAATTDRLAELGVGVAVFDPCGNRPAGGDFLSVMVENAAALEAVAAR